MQNVKKKVGIPRHFLSSSFTSVVFSLHSRAQVLQLLFVQLKNI